METRSIGKLDASVVGLGCNNFGGRIDEAASEAGRRRRARRGHHAVRHRRHLRRHAAARSSSAARSALARDEAIVATKFGGPIDEERKGGASAAYIARAVEDSLRRLGTDRIDLYQLHFPDAATPFEETLGALDELVRAGKVLEIGGSNFSAEQIDETARISADRGLARFVSVQNEYSLLRRGPERFGVLDACARNGVGVHPVLPARERRAHRQVPPQRGAAGRARASPACPPTALDDALSDKVFDRVEALDGFAARPRPHAARARDRVAARAPGGRERDRGRDQARAGRRPTRPRRRGRSPTPTSARSTR